MYTLDRPNRVLIQWNASAVRLSNVGRGRHVATTAGPVDVDVLALGQVGADEFGLDTEGMSTEVVTLRLQQVGGQVLGAVAVVEAQRSGEGRGGNTPEGTLADNMSPAVLGVVDSLVEEVVEQQVLELRVLAVGTGDVLQEDGADNATTAPHESDGGLVQLPAILLGGLWDNQISMMM